MENVPVLIGATAIIAFALGFGLAYLLRGSQARDARDLAAQLMRESEVQRKAYDAQILEMLKGNFARVSVELMNRTQENFMKLAEERLRSQTNDHARELENKKLLIDKQLQTMNGSLDQVKNLVSEFEEKRAEKLGALGKELEQLTKTSSLLQKALADNKARGQWGERMAEDILKMLGFVEGINYTKQTTSEGASEKRIRPDFTFSLPNGMCLNMDVKFPLDNYLASLEAPAQADQDRHRKLFLADVRKRVKDITDRGYIGTAQNTIDCVLVFIPNEQIFRFIHEYDDSIIDDALKQRVIICSPLTLFIVLAVIRQAVENFKIDQSSREILKLLKQFKSEWEKYTDKLEDVGNALEKARSAYADVTGVRRRQLDKPIAQIDLLLQPQEVSDAMAVSELPV
jgi:DNA recombination protein RmuC